MKKDSVRLTVTLQRDPLGTDPAINWDWKKIVEDGIKIPGHENLVQIDAVEIVGRETYATAVDASPDYKSMLEQADRKLGTALQLLSNAIATNVSAADSVNWYAMRAELSDECPVEAVRRRMSDVGVGTAAYTACVDWLTAQAKKAVAGGTKP